MISTISNPPSLQKQKSLFIEKQTKKHDHYFVINFLLKLTKNQSPQKQQYKRKKLEIIPEEYEENIKDIIKNMEYRPVTKEDSK